MSAPVAPGRCPLCYGRLIGHDDGHVQCSSCGMLMPRTEDREGRP